MTRRTFVAAALALWMGAAPAYAAPTASTGALNGVVTGLETGLLLPQVSVTLRSETHPFLEIRHTGRDGAFRFDDVPPGLYSIEATQSGFRPTVVAPILVIPGREVTEHVVLERVPPRVPERPAQTS